MNDREFDVIVWGATGFTGALVAEYLQARYGFGGELRWAIAGRDDSKLADVRRAIGGGETSLAMLTADSFDQRSLGEMASRTRVIISTVGPYAKFGSALVAACVHHGTDYCDLAGEAQWIREMIDTHQDAACESGARIVHCCGFDSVPMDIGAWFLQQEAMQRYGNYCDSITMLVKATKGGPSGGTIASMMNVIRESREDRGIARILVDPYSLNPPDQRS
ncbi:MAG: saccharopine dehydrogenase family protein, partial [Woeseiaceae bacterium]